MSLHSTKIDGQTHIIEKNSNGETIKDLGQFKPLPVTGEIHAEVQRLQTELSKLVNYKVTDAQITITAMEIGLKAIKDTMKIMLE